MNNLNTDKKCLNCGTALTGKYCSECSQASATGRLSFDRLFTGGFIESIFELNRGFFRSCVDLIVRPGELIKFYLEGRRKHYFHFAGLLLILLAVDAILLSFAVNSEVTLLAQDIQNNAEVGDIFSQKGYEQMYGFYKFILAFITPLMALAPYFLFRKLGYYYSEHIVIAWFYFSMCILLSILMRLAGTLPLSYEFFQVLSYISAIALVLVSLRFYWGISAYGNYTVWSRSLRVTTVSLINMLVSAGVPIYITWLLSG